MSLASYVNEVEKTKHNMDFGAHSEGAIDYETIKIG